MRPETRLNLIWIVVLVALMLPGAVTLFRKKYKPGEQPMSFREPVRQSAVYMDPGRFPPGFKRIVPRRTADWLGEVLRERLGVAGGLMLLEQGTERLPPMSASRRVQLVGWTDDAPRRALLLSWGEVPGPIAVSLSDGSTLAALRVERIPVPRDVSLELRDAGYVTPPAGVTAIVVELPPQADELQLQLAGDLERLTLPPRR